MLTYHLHTYFKHLNTNFLAVSQEIYQLVSILFLKNKYFFFIFINRALLFKEIKTVQTIAFLTARDESPGIIANKGWQLCLIFPFVICTRSHYITDRQHVSVYTHPNVSLSRYIDIPVDWIIRFYIFIIYTSLFLQIFILSIKISMNMFAIVQSVVWLK